MPNLMEPLTQIRRQGSLSRGSAHWLGQRISASLLMTLSILFLVEILRHTQSDYQMVLTWAAQPWVGAGLALWVGGIFYHSALGLQVIIEDYVSNVFWQVTLTWKLKMISLVLVILSWFFIIRIAIIGNG